MFPPSGSCTETAGFLFSHPCKNPAIQGCGTCGKSICASHVRLVGTATMCVTCSRTQTTESFSDPYDYPTTWYSDYRSYDRWDRYRRRSAAQETTGETLADASGLEDVESWDATSRAPAGNDPNVGFGAPADDSGWESDFDAS